MPEYDPCETKPVARCDMKKCCEERHIFVCLWHSSYCTTRQKTKLKFHKLQKIPVVTETNLRLLSGRTRNWVSWNLPDGTLSGWAKATEGEKRGLHASGCTLSCSLATGATHTLLKGFTWATAVPKMNVWCASIQSIHSGPACDLKPTCFLPSHFRARVCVFVCVCVCGGVGGAGTPVASVNGACHHVSGFLLDSSAHAVIIHSFYMYPMQQRRRYVPTLSTKKRQKPGRTTQDTETRSKRLLKCPHWRSNSVSFKDERSPDTATSS